MILGQHKTPLILTPLQQPCTLSSNLISPPQLFGRTSALNVPFPFHHQPCRQEWFLIWRAVLFLPTWSIGFVAPLWPIRATIWEGVATYPNPRASSTAPAMVTL